MGRTKRIILADTEQSVTGALEMQFLCSLRNDPALELEVITDPAYFEALFSQPQEADVLVCGETLFTPELRKHNIGSLFLLCENADEAGAEDLPFKRIPKYSNPKEIMKLVLAGGDIRPAGKKEPLILVVYSASGGVGRTTVAMGLCACLEKNFKKVLYLNAEHINTFQSWLSNASPVPNAVLPELAAAGDNVFERLQHVIRSEKFDYLPPLSASLSSLGLPFSIYEKIAVSAKRSQKYDVIVVDADTVFDAEKAALLTTADRVLMVVRQTRTSVLAMNTVISNMNCSDNSKYFFVCNDFDSGKKNALVIGNVKPRFHVSEYIEHMEGAEAMQLAELAAKPGIQKTSYLIL